LAEDDSVDAPEASADEVDGNVQAEESRQDEAVSEESASEEAVAEDTGSEDTGSEDTDSEETLSEEAVTEKSMHEMDAADESGAAPEDLSSEASGDEKGEETGGETGPNSDPAPEQGTAPEDGSQEAGSDEEGSEEEGEEDAPREPVEIPNLPQIIEGAILAADKPLSIDHIIQLFPDGEPSRAMVREAIIEIQEHCEGRGYELKEVASGYRFQVRQAYGDWIGRLWDERPPRYTRALLETLALIAYKQPITRGDIEDIRGVAVSTNIIRTLLEREWIRVVGHRDVPGRPSIYATTKTFLDYFDLSSLDELPTLSEIKDLDKMNEELDLEGELIEPRSLSLEDTSDEIDATLADDESLDEVTDRVNAIQENIKNLFREPEEDLDDDLDGDEDDRSNDEVAAEVDESSEASDDVSDVTAEASLSETSAGDEDGAAAEAGDETVGEALDDTLEETLEETEVEEVESPDTSSEAESPNETFSETSSETSEETEDDDSSEDKPTY
jgi:segregation and condensation protein B